MNKLSIMKRIYILILLAGLSSGSLCAQFALGVTGQSLIPTAEMQQTGTFMGGANFLPEQVTPDNFSYPTMNYYVNMTLFSFIELNYRMTLLKTPDASGKKTYHEQDRSNTIRIRPLAESRLLPAVVFGIDDLFTEEAGSQFWGAYYGVLTKHFDWRGGHTLAVTAGWYIPAGGHPYNKGPFGGVSYIPAFCRELRLMAEYDSHGWNVGGAVRLWRHFTLHAFTRQFTCVSAGVRYECTLIH